MTTTPLATATAAAVPGTDVLRTVPPPIPFARLLRVELTKMVNTRTGFWLLAATGTAGVLATVLVVLVAPDSSIVYDTFAGAVGVPMTILLPIVAILSVTGEWSQRNGLTTFTLVPHRSRVIAAKAVDAVAIGAVSIGAALGVGALGNLAGAAVVGVDPVWDISLVTMLQIVLANVLGLLVGFTLGVLLRSSAGAIVAYFVYSFVVPTLSMVLAASQGWYRGLQQWVDFNYAQSSLFDDAMSRAEWAHLAVTGLVWLAAPLALGLYLVSRSEVK